MKLGQTTSMDYTYGPMFAKSCKRMVESPFCKMGFKIPQLSTAGFRNHPQYEICRDMWCPRGFGLPGALLFNQKGLVPMGGVPLNGQLKMGIMMIQSTPQIFRHTP